MSLLDKISELEEHLPYLMSKSDSNKLLQGQESKLEEMVDELIKTAWHLILQDFATVRDILQLLENNNNGIHSPVELRKRLHEILSEIATVSVYEDDAQSYINYTLNIPTRTTLALVGHEKNLSGRRIVDNPDTIVLGAQEFIKKIGHLIEQGVVLKD